MANLRLSGALLGGLASPAFADRAGEAIGQSMLAPERRRQEQEKMDRMDASITAFRQAGAAAQEGDVGRLTEQIDALQAQASEADTVEEKLFYLNQMRTLQGQMPGARQAKQARSVDSLLRIDQELEDTAALRDRINASNAANGMPPISEADFKRLTDTLKTQRNNILDDPDVSSDYRARKADRLAEKLEIERLESVAWIAENGDGIKKAIKSGSQEELDAALKDVPQKYQSQVDAFVSSQIRSEEQLQDFRNNSIAQKQAPVNTDFSSRIQELGAAGLDTGMLEEMNRQYMDYVKKNWNGSEWVGGLPSKDQASRLEQNILRTIERQSDAVTMNEWRSEQDRIAREQAQIEDAKESIDTFKPSRLDIVDRAELLALEDDAMGSGDKFTDLSSEEQAQYRNDAEAQLIEENARRETLRIRRIDTAQTPADMMRSIDEKQAATIAKFTPDEQQIIMEEYAIDEGLTDVDEIIEDLIALGDIKDPADSKDDDPKKEQTLYRREPGFRFMDRMQERYDRNVEGLAKLRQGTPE